MLSVSIIIPVFNEADHIVAHLKRLKKVVADIPAEIIVVDGGSEDATLALATPYVDHAITATKGRAKQMNAGAKLATNDCLLFLHIDTLLPDQAFNFLTTPVQWGFYKVKLSGRSWCFRVIEKMMVWRSSLTRIATGDQCIFVNNELFTSIDGYADIPLMEDVELCKRLRKIAQPIITHTSVTTSSRRWERKGILRTVWLMWCLRAQYFLGVSPDVLVKKYYQ